MTIYEITNAASVYVEYDYDYRIRSDIYSEETNENYTLVEKTSVRYGSLEIETQNHLTEDGSEYEASENVDIYTLKDLYDGSTCLVLVPDSWR